MVPTTKSTADFHRQVIAHAGRTTEDQKSVLTTVLLSEAQPGDILYKYGHVAIYIGGDQYIHEPQTGDVCKVSSGINYFTCALRANR